MLSDALMRNSKGATFLFRETIGSWKRSLRRFAGTDPETNMARSDLLVSLVKAGSSGDRRSFRSAAEAIIAEERSKQHAVLADRLTNAIQPNGNGNGNVMRGGLQAVAPELHRGRDFISEVVPRRRLDDLILPLLAKQ